MSKCDHEKIVKFIEAFRDKEGNLFIIMELCDDNLYHKRYVDLDGQEFYDEGMIDVLIKQICEVLKYIHENDLALRDIDPKNVLIKWSDKVRRLWIIETS